MRNSQKCRLFSDRRGEGYTDLCIGVLVFVAVIAVALNLFSILSLRVELDRIADTLLETATESGAFGSEYEDMEAELQAANGSFSAQYGADAFFNSGYRTVQLGDRMQVTVTAETVFGVGSFGFPITVSVTKHGLSERYWK